MDDVLSQTELFVHRNRPQWGLAICTESRQNKSDFLFQDGTVRTFRDDFLHLMVAADRPRDVTARVVNRLRAQANGSMGTTGSTGVGAGADILSLEDQVLLFKGLFPEGFSDQDFIAKHRGEPDMRRRKGHHGVATEEAQKTLASDALMAAFENGAQLEIVDLACGVMERSSLAPKATITALRERAGMVGFAEQLYSVLYNDEVSEFDRFTRWLMVLEAGLGAPAGWEIATALPALIHPNEHVAVKRAPFQREARWMAPSLMLAKNPNAELYRRARDMTVELRDALVEAGLAPKDLLDVSTFIQIVQRPKHIQEFEAARDAD